MFVSLVVYFHYTIPNIGVLHTYSNNNNNNNNNNDFFYMKFYLMKYFQLEYLLELNVVYMPMENSLWSIVVSV